MRKIEIKEMKQIQLQILEVIATFCEEKRLRYFLGYGSLIGAVRHHGYIPWDDDIDLVMPRPDYDRLLQIFNDYDYNIKVIDNSIDDEYYLPFAKIHDTRTVIHEKMYKKCQYGVFIDIFPLDGYTGMTQVKKMTRYFRYLNAKKATIGWHRSIIKNIIIIAGKLFLIPFPVKSIISKMQVIATEGGYEECEIVNSLFSPYSFKEMCKKTMLEDTIFMEFEGREYRIPREYDSYLRQIYGNYMQLPSERARVTHHAFDAYWK